MLQQHIVLIFPCASLAGQSRDEEGKATGEIEIPNLSDENEVEEVDVSEAFPHTS